MTEQQWAWEPEDDQENVILAAANYILRFGHPPVGWRICRRVPAQGAGVPVPTEVRERALEEYRDDNQ